MLISGMIWVNGFCFILKGMFLSPYVLCIETELQLIYMCVFIFQDLGNSPLHAAAKAGQATQVELLIVNGADPSALDSNGKTAAEIAM